MTTEELGLWERYGQGEEAARKALILLYLPMVEPLARRIARSAGWTDWEDLRQDGIIGLMQAMARFDPRRGVAFKTFARFYIRGANFDSSELTRALARRQQEICRQVREAEAELTAMLQRQPTLEEVERATGLSGEQILMAMDAVGLTFADALADADTEAVAATEPARSETTTLVREALAQLTERAARIVIYYYVEGRSTREISRQLDLSVSNVTKIRQRAMRKLSKLLGEKR